MSNSCSVVYTRIAGASNIEVSYEDSSSVSTSTGTSPDSSASLCFCDPVVHCVVDGECTVSTATKAVASVDTNINACSTVRASVICEISHGLYLRISPQYLWIFEDDASINDVYSNTTWNVN